MAVTEGVGGSSSHVVTRIPKRGPGTNGSEDTADEHIVARREELLTDKRQELAKLLEEHDTAVRICLYRTVVLLLMRVMDRCVNCSTWTGSCLWYPTTQGYAETFMYLDLSFLHLVPHQEAKKDTSQVFESVRIGKMAPVTIN